MRKNTFGFYISLFVISIGLLGCSDTRSSGGGNDANARGIGGLDAADVPIIEVDPADAGEADSGEDDCCGPPCQCGPEYEHQLSCWKTQLFFCTPDGLPPGDDPTLYQQQVVLDVCDENGEPCTPAFPNDPDCQWQVVSMGECENWLECDPTSADTLVQEDVPCTDVDEFGEEYNGVQDFICQKGQILAGPCEPCGEEICDAIDNDCDGVIDEGTYPCESECGPGNSICIDGELVLCDAPLPTPEVCDGIDNDCDLEVDEELVQECSTDCEQGVEFCIEGTWTGCTAQPPFPEICNGMDDDCNNLIDDGLDCACPPEMIGLLVPCMEEPLVCGQGFKSCECADQDCVTTQMSQCFAMCHWLPDPNEVCDPTGGMPVPEVCNNFDDDCDIDVDEGLFAQCYSGPEGTVNVGVCIPGELMCVGGNWGNYIDNLFVEDMCLGEVTPLEEDLCTGQDDNCDGVIENFLEDTDILFIVDVSGSMSSTINAVQTAMSMFSAHYADQEVVQWGLVVGPIQHTFQNERLEMITNLVPFDQFLPALASIDDDSTGSEMLYDALLLSIRNLIPLGAAPPLPPLGWDNPGSISSNPTIQNWSINWREDANHVVIVFSDEPGQSFMSPEITQEILLEQIAAAEDLSVYSFSEISEQNGQWGWGPVSIGGSWFPLTVNPQVMFDNLMDIIEETACGGAENEEEEP